MQVEFNKAALSLADSLGGDLKKVALNRLLKVAAQQLPPITTQQPDNYLEHIVVSSMEHPLGLMMFFEMDAL